MSTTVSKGRMKGDVSIINTEEKSTTWYRGWVIVKGPIVLNDVNNMIDDAK